MTQDAQTHDAQKTGRHIALLSMGLSAALATSKIAVGLAAQSAAVVSDGIESASDVVASGIVLFGLTIAAKPADEDHPYGHGRFELMAALLVGFLLAGTGLWICFRAMRHAQDNYTPAAFAIWPLIVSTFVKGAISIAKFRTGRRIRSEALIADGWNDTVDILSGLVALSAVSLSIWFPGQFAAADRYGAFAVGLIVIFLGLRVMRETALQLADTMPDPRRLDDVRRAALTVPGALAVEKCFARKTGLGYHVDLHLEVDGEMTVRESHLLGHHVRDHILAKLPWVADVLVHVEPHAAATIDAGSGWRTGK